ncbi:hypothetical protein CXG81DRAFT_892, partial [Caulochytrium protostelioides]
DAQGYDALHLAAHCGAPMLTHYLLASGIDVNTRDAAGRTPLMWAAYQANSLDTLEALCWNGGDALAVDDSGFTALHWAV